jgi:predicted nucleic-acid-binding protein
VRITADTNLLVRAVTFDHPRQSPLAAQLLNEAEMVALPLPALCELAWVLSRTYRFATTEISQAISRLLDADNVVVDRRAAEAGIAQLDVGGDFADGIIAFEGRALGADTFLSFDRDAVRQLQTRGEAAQLLA